MHGAEALCEATRAAFVGGRDRECLAPRWILFHDVHVLVPVDGADEILLVEVHGLRMGVHPLSDQIRQVMAEEDFLLVGVSLTQGAQPVAAISHVIGDGGAPTVVDGDCDEQESAQFEGFPPRAEYCDEGVFVPIEAAAPKVDVVVAAGVGDGNPHGGEVDEIALRLHSERRTGADVARVEEQVDLGVVGDIASHLAHESQILGAHRLLGLRVPNDHDVQGVSLDRAGFLHEKIIGLAPGCYPMPELRDVGGV